jgi:hypothetical protein
MHLMSDEPDHLDANYRHNHGRVATVQPTVHVDVGQEQP